jgi:hypothetical protein
LTQWQGPSLEGYAGFWLLLIGFIIIGAHFYGTLGSAVAFIGSLIVYAAIGQIFWKKSPRLANRKSWPAYWSAFWRQVLLGVGISLLVILVEFLYSGINSAPYDFIFGLALVVLGTIFEIIGRKKPPLGLSPQPQVSK